MRRSDPGARAHVSPELILSRERISLGHGSFKLRVASFTISLDGFGAGRDQSLQNPMGVGGSSLHEWAFSTRTIQRLLLGGEGGSIGPDHDFAARGFRNIGAWILGRNMFGPVRGPWPDDTWKGWWGDSPLYHTPSLY